MFRKPFGIVVLAAALLTAGLAGIAAVLAVWPRTPNTSPLAALIASAWSCTYIVAAHLTWRRSRFASPAFVAAMGFLLLLSSLIFPGGGLILLPPFAVIVLFGFLGYRYLERAHEAA